MVTFPMISTDRLPGFQGHGIFEVEYLKTVRFTDKVTVAH